eukprot:7830203-Karenia_brevis.AAC.1
MSLTYAPLPSYLGWYGKRKSTSEDKNDEAQGSKANDSAASGGACAMSDRKQDLNTTESAELTQAVFKAVEALQEKSRQH